MIIHRYLFWLKCPRIQTRGDPVSVFCPLVAHPLYFELAFPIIEPFQNKKEITQFKALSPILTFKLPFLILLLGCSFDVKFQTHLLFLRQIFFIFFLPGGSSFTANLQAIVFFLFNLRDDIGVFISEKFEINKISHNSSGLHGGDGLTCLQRW